MKPSRIFLSLAAFLACYSPVSHACSKAVGPAEVILDLTNYAPLSPNANGIDQGHCRGGASGESPCRHLLEDYLAGSVPKNRKFFPGQKVTYVMSAVPQRMESTGIKNKKQRKKILKQYESLAKKYKAQTGKQEWTPSANMFGAYYRAVTLEQKISKQTGKQTPCIVIGARDRYATSSNGLSKMDIATVNANASKKVNGKKVQNREVAAVGESDHATFLPLGRIEGMKAPKTKIQRDPEALSFYKPSAVTDLPEPASEPAAPAVPAAAEDTAKVEAPVQPAKVPAYNPASPFASMTSEDLDAHQEAQAQGQAAKKVQQQPDPASMTSEDLDAYQEAQAQGQAAKKDRLKRKPASLPEPNPERFGD